ncbi:hypothetical protein BCD67_24880 [Oscillatoriales cyanobacterium USR001]|nr:hypothetical protein BCD67_24880 [Oscillatoriales cyanobacterium USR001]
MLADTLTPADIYPPAAPPNSTTVRQSCIQTEKRLFEGKLYQCKAIKLLEVNFSNNDLNNNVNLVLQNIKNRCWSAFVSSSFSNADFASGGTDQGSEVFSGLVLERQIDLLSSYGVGNYDWKKPCKPLDDKPETCSIDIGTMIKNAFKYKFPMDLLGDNPIGEINPSCPVMTVMGQTFELCYILDLVRGLKYPLLLVFVLNTLTKL